MVNKLKLNGDANSRTLRNLIIGLFITFAISNFLKRDWINGLFALCFITVMLIDPTRSKSHKWVQITIGIIMWVLLIGGIVINYLR